MIKCQSLSVLVLMANESSDRFVLMAELHLRHAHEVVALLRQGAVSPLQLIDVVEARIHPAGGIRN